MLLSNVFQFLDTIWFTDVYFALQLILKPIVLGKVTLRIFVA